MKKSRITEEQITFVVALAGIEFARLRHGMAVLILWLKRRVRG
jgi:hypothetical protein